MELERANDVLTSTLRHPSPDVTLASALGNRRPSPRILLFRLFLSSSLFFLKKMSSSPSFNYIFYNLTNWVPVRCNGKKYMH